MPKGDPLNTFRKPWVKRPPELSITPQDSWRMIWWVIICHQSIGILVWVPSIRPLSSIRPVFFTELNLQQIEIDTPSRITTFLNFRWWPMKKSTLGIVRSWVHTSQLAKSSAYVRDLMPKARVQGLMLKPSRYSCNYGSRQGYSPSPDGRLTASPAAIRASWYRTAFAIALKRGRRSALGLIKEL